MGRHWHCGVSCSVQDSMRSKDLWICGRHKSMFQLCARGFWSCSLMPRKAAICGLASQDSLTATFPARIRSEQHTQRLASRVCVCVCVCLLVCLFVCVDACMHAWIDGCMHGCLSVCMYACMYACMHACMHVWMHVCTHACVCVCACARIYM